MTTVILAGVVASLLTAPTQAALQPLAGSGVFRQGPGVSAPVLLKEVKPRYTAATKQAKIQGRVTLECVVLPNGRAGDIKVIRTLHPDLDRQAIKAVKQWRFKSGTKDGKPVPVQVSIELSFTLRP
jgi:periplasmic protein TonB